MRKLAIALGTLSAVQVLAALVLLYLTPFLCEGPQCGDGFPVSALASIATLGGVVFGFAAAAVWEVSP